MRGNELLDKMELIDPAYIEAADTAPNKCLGEVGGGSGLPLPGLRAGRPRHGGLQSGIL